MDSWKHSIRVKWKNMKLVISLRPHVLTVFCWGFFLTYCLMVQVWHETVKQFGDKPACRRHFSFFGYFFLPFQKMEKNTNISAVSLHYLSLMNLMICNLMWDSTVCVAPSEKAAGQSECISPLPAGGNTCTPLRRAQGKQKSWRFSAIPRTGCTDVDREEDGLLILSHYERTRMPANQLIWSAAAWHFSVPIYTLNWCLNDVVDLL